LFLNDRKSDEAKLASMHLPILSTPADLANALGITIAQLRWLTYHSEVATRIHYVQFQIPKKSGGTRTLSAPHAKLAKAQEWIFTQILEKLAVESASHGFIKDRSIVTNAEPHCQKEIVINVDLEGFFPSISVYRVRHCFQRLGYSGAVATLLALLCTECPRQKVQYAGNHYYVATGKRGLPQGACTSPGLSNQISRRLDRRLMGLASRMKLQYTRYADDLTISGDDDTKTKVGYILARLRHICQDEGFQLNPKKTRVQRKNTRQSVTGIVVNKTMSPPRELVKRVRAILHRAAKDGLKAQNLENIPNFVAWLDGMIAYISMVKPAIGEKFRKQFEQVRNAEQS
jgi:RNA-directed DNA polymerase